MKGLSQLYYLHGIGYDYTKYTGEHVVFEEKVRTEALRCCGIETADSALIEQLNFELDIAPWQRVVDDVCLIEQHDSLLKFKLPDHQLDGLASLKIQKLDYAHEFELTSGVVVGEYQHLGVRYVEVAFQVAPISTGYYSAILSLPCGQYETQVWSVPTQCYNPLQSKVVGLSIQLYTLRSDRNLGIGDFGDLQDLISHSAQSQCDYILLNPLHLLFFDQQHRVSPYSPNHRSLLNPLYIAVELCDGFADSQALTELYQQTLSQLQDQKSQTYIDYAQVSEHKYGLLSALYVHFKTHRSTQEVSQFIAFQEDFSTALEALDGDEQAIYWQWLAWQQLESCQQLALKMGMCIGLINDLAVGCADDSLEYQANRTLYAQNAHVGAPPDPWAESGQNWGLPALNPLKIKRRRYEFFKQLLRNNMRAVGGLRIDHVMAIRRLWWCFEVEEKRQGCYVYYPFEHLMALIKIESQLQQTLVIGEDLGVVPPEIKAVMQEANMLGNVLFYFEKNYNGEFVPQTELRHQALLMVANHDVPPFVAWWQGDDLLLRVEYQLLEENELESERLKRENEKHKLLSWLADAGVSHLDINSRAFDVYERLMLALSHCPTQMLCMQLDDLDEQTLPVNIPGTYLEYPNWRRRLSRSTGEIFEHKGDFIATLTQSRKGI
ncbi:MULTISPECIES: 4-alpha-glucanotransferase [Pseudoalteromonas]|uniref:4-alpha-glucanotransferase n=1 Tax=Pseudoalteromonas amylolytica TaxID=1859457 RepID=A0A1S1MW25_9GAMM|nr:MULTISPECIES: 4-alpha-glucanotransferase [Pseudoalteromonas]OHU85397.1 4-alpha-glucanotransferase [Pseudoalteromonas sp. JW3]OHU92982.1 4-alpha-glucanotransferase [Pseudoalteromonas amylolytica]